MFQYIDPHLFVLEKLRMFFKSLCQFFAPDGPAFMPDIRVNAIAPGVIETAMNASTRNDPETLARFMHLTPMSRTGQTGERVGPLLFVASYLSFYVTGAMLCRLTAVT